MTCEACRQALSARLDGEEDPRERAAVDGHLDTCADCQDWYDDAADITRLARTALVSPPGAGVPVTVLDAAPSPWRARTARALRWLLAVLGAAQFLLGVAQIATLAGQAHTHTGQVASAGHLWHESAAWNLAIGAGFAWIAVRRGRPSGIVPTLTVFVVVLSLLSAADLVAGRVEGRWLLSHAIIVLGYLIIVLLSRPSYDYGGPAGGRRPWPWRLRLDPAEADGGADRRAPVRSTPDVAAHHRAAA